MSSSLRATGEGLVWLVGVVVCLLAANRGSNCSLTRAMDGRIRRTVRYGRDARIPFLRATAVTVGTAESAY